MGARDFLKNAQPGEETGENTPDSFTIGRSSKKEDKVEVNTELVHHEAEERPKRRKRNTEENDKNSGPYKVKRQGVPMNKYMAKPIQHSLYIFNKDVHRFYKNFSDDNQLNDGAALNKSAVIEAVLDVAYYDMELEPDGFQSIEEIRNFLRSKLK